MAEFLRLAKVTVEHDLFYIIRFVEEMNWFLPFPLFRSGISLRENEWFQANFLLFISLIITFMSSIIVGLLFLYHSYLMLTGQTTWEQASRHRIHYLKDLPSLTNPFNEGCLCNTLRFIFHGRVRDWETLYLMRTGTTIKR